MCPQSQPDPSPDAATVEDRVGGDGPPPAANQRRTEPMPDKTTPANTASSDGATTAAGAPGSSAVQEQGTARPAVAVPGKPDGEVDTSA